jgi:hypothetical protein
MHFFARILPRIALACRSRAAPRVRAPPQDEFAPLQRVNSGPLPGSRATCAYGALLGTGGSLAAGGARTRVNVYGTAGGTRVFYLALPAGYDAAGAPPRPLLLALHGGASYGDGFLDGAWPTLPLRMLRAWR